MSELLPEEAEREAQALPPALAAPGRRRFLLILALANLASLGVDVLLRSPAPRVVLGARIALTLLLVALHHVGRSGARPAVVRRRARMLLVGLGAAVGALTLGADGAEGPYLAFAAVLPLLLSVFTPDDLVAVLLGAGSCAGVAMLALWGEPSQDVLYWVAVFASAALYAAYGVILSGRTRARHRQLEADRDDTAGRLARVERERSLERAERELLWQRLEILSQASNEILLFLDAAGRVVQANDRAVEAYGYPLDELLGLNLAELCPPEIRAETAASVEASLRAGARRFSTLHLRRDGTVFPVEVSTRTVTMNGSPYLQGLVRDVTEERRAHAALAYQARLLANLHDAVVGIDARLTITGWNAAAERIYGWKSAEVMGRPFQEVLPAAWVDGSSHEELFARALAQGPITREVHRQVRTGRWLDIEATVVPLLGSEAKPEGYVILSRDITRRKRAELALREAQRRMNRILETSNEAIWIVDVQGRTEFANPRAAELFGLTVDDLLGRTFVEVLPEPLRRAAEADLEAIARGDSTRREMGLPRADGSVARLIFSRTALRDESGRVSGAVGFFVDVTEQRRVEEELQQATRLEAVGRLAAGIAHEINTPIQYIGDNTTFLRDAFAGVLAFVRGARPRDGAAPASPQELERIADEADLDYVMERAPGTLQRTLDGVERVATIVRAMKEFARQDDREMVPTDLNRALTVTLEVARNEYKYVADVKTEFGPLPLVTCHPGEMNQVFLNLIVNAGHAVADATRESRGRGEIRITTSTEGGDVIVAVSDTGTGIPEEIRSRIFDPFFTTKEVGRGSGQGLALARGVVAKHGGQIGFTTAVGQGTTFRVRFPVDPRGQRAERA